MKQGYVLYSVANEVVGVAYWSIFDVWRVRKAYRNMRISISHKRKK